MNVLLAISLGVFLIATVAPSLSEEVASRDRFDLFTGCEPIDLIVADLDNDAIGLGLSKDSIETMVQSKLIENNIYDGKKDDYLFVYVNTLPSKRLTASAYVIDVEFEKVLFDENTGLNNFATTWQAGSLGVTGNEIEGILESVSRHTDNFIAEYLEVNKDSCD